MLQGETAVLAKSHACHYLQCVCMLTQCMALPSAQVQWLDDLAIEVPCARLLDACCTKIQVTTFCGPESTSKHLSQD